MASGGLGNLQFGGIFGGLAEGAAQGMQLDATARDHLLRQINALKTQQQMDLKLSETFGPKFAEAFLDPNPVTRNPRIGALLEAWGNMQGQPVNKGLVSFFKGDPEEASALLNSVEKRGGSIVDIFRLANDPLKFEALLGAHAATARATNLQEAAAGGTAPAPETPALGKGLKIPGVAAQAPTSTSTAGTQAPTGPLENDAKAIEGRIRQLQGEAGTIIRSGATSKGIPPAVAELYKGKLTEIAALRDQLYKIRQGPAVQQAQELDQPVPQDRIDAARVEAKYAGVSNNASAAMFPTGIKLRDFNTQMDRLRSIRGGVEPSAQTPTGQITLMPGGVAPATGLKTGGQQPITPAEKAAAVTEANQSITMLPEAMLRDPALRGRPDIKTYGDLKASGLQLQDANNRTAAQAAIGHYETSAGAEYQKVIDTADDSRKKNNFYNVALSAAQRLGPSGAWVTPLRNHLSAGAGLFGFPQAFGAGERDILQAVAPKLAISLTTQMKGQQSDREFINSMLSEPNVGQTPKGLAIMMFIGKELTRIDMEKGAQARRWLAQHPDHPSLNTPDANGFTFNESFKYHYEDKLDLVNKVAKAFKMTPVQIYNTITGTEKGQQAYDKAFGRP